MEDVVDAIQYMDWYRFAPFLAMILGLICMGLIADKISNRRKARRVLPMTKEEREAHVKRVLADVITAGLEDAEYRGWLTRGEIDGAYNNIGVRCGYPDLLRIANKKHQTAVKDGIKARLKNGANRPVTLPSGPTKPVTKLTDLFSKRAA